MSTRVLVPLDGRKGGQRALAFAEPLARRMGAELDLLRIPRTRSSVFGDPAIDSQREVMIAQDYVDRLARRLRDRGLAVDARVRLDGTPADRIVHQSSLRRADLVVMATHARSGPARWLHGSVAESVVQSAAAPIMLVAPRVESHVAERLSDAHPCLIVPLDGSERANQALPVAQRLASSLAADIVLVSVNTVADTHTPIANAQRVRRTGDPATEIARVADERGAAAIVMATHGRAGWSRAVLGSVAGGVLERASVPVVVVRADAAAGDSSAAPLEES